MDIKATAYDEAHKIYSIEHLIEKLFSVLPPLWNINIYIFSDDTFGDHPSNRKCHVASRFGLSSGRAGVYCEKDTLQEALTTLIKWHEEHPEAAQMGVNDRVYLGDSHKPTEPAP